MNRTDYLFILSKYPEKIQHFFNKCYSIRYDRGGNLVFVYILVTTKILRTEDELITELDRLEKTISEKETLSLF